MRSEMFGIRSVDGRDRAEPAFEALFRAVIETLLKPKPVLVGRLPDNSPVDNDSVVESDAGKADWARRRDVSYSVDSNENQE